MMAAHKVRTGDSLTYAVLAERTGLSRATVESIASRKRYNASLATIERLCAALQCGPGELLEIIPDGRGRRAK
ncbi:MULTISPECIES: helix-turn-helix domain-containing protein [unclassified Bradyrhizobium]